jgi:uncharacterized protein (DUF1697 family)
MEKHYLALLRGINVGGKNIIKMAALKACFEDMGFAGVTTYIQSGNVLFKASSQNREKLGSKIDNALAKQFNYTYPVFVISHNELQHAVGHAPEGFGANPDEYRYDVIFVKKPLTATTAIKSISTKEGVDTAHAGKGVLYFSRLIANASKSHLSRIIKLPIYQDMTIRNWNTTTKLLSLMDSATF